MLEYAALLILARLALKQNLWVLKEVYCCTSQLSTPYWVFPVALQTAINTPLRYKPNYNYIAPDHPTIRHPL
jgi:hypothetical protein